jgi:hypothetical protein
MDTVERTYFAFRRGLRDIGQASVCDCNACTRMPESEGRFLDEPVVDSAAVRSS